MLVSLGRKVCPECGAHVDIKTGEILDNETCTDSSGSRQRRDR